LGLETLFPKGAPYAEVEGLCVLEGPEKVVQVEEQMLKDLLKEHGAKYTGSEGGEKWWKTRLLRSSFLFKEGVRVNTSVHVPIGKAGYYMKFMRDTVKDMMKKYNVKCYVGGLSEGNSACLYAITMYHEDNPDEHERALKCGIEMNENILLKAGFEPSVGTSWPNATRICMASYVELIKRVKNALDPNHIMSPGVLGL